MVAVDLQTGDDRVAGNNPQGGGVDQAIGRVLKPDTVSATARRRKVRQFNGEYGHSVNAYVLLPVKSIVLALMVNESPSPMVVLGNVP